MKLPEDPDPPEAAVYVWYTKIVNDYLGTAYTVEEIAEWPPEAIETVLAVMRGMNPPRGKGK